MTYAPPTLNALRDYWKAQGGAFLGIVGDTGHVDRGVSYHLGKSQLTATAYSRRTARDKAGLTEAASAIDLGRLDGSLPALRGFSIWFAGRCRDRDPAYRDVREVIWWDQAGGVVLGWSDLSPKAYIRNYGDLTHKMHTHISFYRDSEKRPKVPMFRPYFDEVPAVPTFKAFAKPKYVTIPDKGWLYVMPDLSNNAGNVQVSPGPRDMPLSGTLTDGTLIVGYVDTTPTEPTLPTYYVKGTPKDYPTGLPGPDDTPFDQADLDAAFASGGTTERERIALAEAERIRHT